MKCPHCSENFHPLGPQKFTVIEDAFESWAIEVQKCPACNQYILHLKKSKLLRPVSGGPSQYPPAARMAPTALLTNEYLVYPRAALRPAAPKETPTGLAEDYREACLVLADSPKSSAALSRRCLQSLLRDHAGFTAHDLYKQIDEAVNSKTLPSQLADSLDAVRLIGNFAAHPVKSQKSGEILDVEPGEAEWTLDVLEELFDFYFVQPAKLQAKRAALNAKLVEAGKKPLN